MGKPSKECLLETCLAVDFGLTNLDVVIVEGEEHRYASFPSGTADARLRLESLIEELKLDPHRLAWIATTGGRYRQLPAMLGNTPLVGITEMDAIGRGGLHLAKKTQALVVSAGTGTAMIAARPERCSHVTGSAVGGGTLLGLGRLLLGTVDPWKIDALAQDGDANRADLTLIEATGGQVGKLPLDANAVNFGRLARQEVDLRPQDTAAALVRLVGQVIAVIAINAARSEGLDDIVVIGRLVVLPTVCKVLKTVAGYYQASITITQDAGFGTALGALITCQQRQFR